MKALLKKKKVLLFSKIIFSIIYCMVAGEMFLRIFDPVPMLPRYVCQTDYGIRGNAPNKSYYHVTPEYKVHIQTNSKGIRSDREIPYEKPDSIKRIVLLGDSFGMGYGVNYEQMFTSQMTEYLKLKYGVNAEVINLSTSGHGNAEELIVLENEGFKYSPDLVLLAWHSTDFNDNIRSDLYGLEEGKLVTKNSTYLPGVKTREFLFQFTAYRFLAENSQFYNFFRDWAGYNAKVILALLKSSRNEKAVDTTCDKKKDEVYPKALMFALLKEIQGKCHENNAEFMILTIPGKRSRTEFISRFPEEFANDTSLNIFSPLEKFCEAKGPKLYWERSHGHFTPLGCEIVGEGLADFIVNKKLLE